MHSFVFPLLQLQPSVPGGLAGVASGLRHPLPLPVVWPLPLLAQPPQALPEEASVEVSYHGGEGGRVEEMREGGRVEEMREGGRVREGGMNELICSSRLIN